MGVWMWMAVASAADAGACAPWAKEALLEASDRIEATWASGEGAAFGDAHRAFEAALSCVDAPFVPAEAVRIHRSQALVAFVKGDAEAAKRSMMAARTLDPSWALPVELVPPGHPLWKVYAAAEPPAEPALVPFLATPSHDWSVDGTPFRAGPLHKDELPDLGLPADRAFVLQILDDDGAPTWTGYHLSTATVPVDAFELGPDPAELRARRRKNARIWGSVVGGALLVGGGTAFGVGWSERERIANGEVPLTEVEATAAKANTLGGVSCGLGGAGALLVTLAWSVPW